MVLSAAVLHGPPRGVGGRPSDRSRIDRLGDRGQTAGAQGSIRPTATSCTTYGD